MHQLLCLHSGGSPVSYDELSSLRTPEATKTHCPISHFEFVRNVKDSLRGLMDIDEEQHAVSHEDNRYFGILALKGQEASFGLMLGLRNSHDKTFPAGFALGTRVFVCDNLAFSSEIVLRRKHTSRIMEDLPGLVARGIGLLAERVRSIGDQVKAYQAMPVDDSRAYEFIVRGYKAKAIPARAIDDVLHQWEHPDHEEFQPRNAWSLFNAFTSTYKQANPELSWPRSQRLHGLFDSLTGFKAPTMEAELV
jgi:hypothetical protein